MSDSAVEKRLRRAAMDEAQHLAAEIHDGVGQELAGISLQLAALRRVPQARHREIQEPLVALAVEPHQSRPALGHHDASTHVPKGA
jgi:signal transduction histidine kinase